MKHIDLEHYRTYPGKGGATAPAVYVIGATEFPFDISEPAKGRTCTVVEVGVRKWNNSLTPWPAPGLYRGDPDFSGEAPITLAELLDEAIPAIEQAKAIAPTKRAICGYSLGGLFALYAFAHNDVFAACACLSGSVWYEGWVDHLRGLKIDGAGRFAFLSIGSKEKHAAPKILHHVQDNMEQCAAILRECGCKTEYVVGPGNHMSLRGERFAAGFAALDSFLTQQ